MAMIAPTTSQGSFACLTLSSSSLKDIAVATTTLPESDRFAQDIEDVFLSQVATSLLVSAHQGHSNTVCPGSVVLVGDKIQFIYKELDNGNKVLAVFLDLAKALDSIHYDILLKILLTFGINNRSLLWFKSYLSCTKQIVKLNDITSNENIIKYGVSQGSVLGPVLFILYIDAVCKLKIDAKIVTYVDDIMYLLFLENSWDNIYHKGTKNLNDYKL